MPNAAVILWAYLIALAASVAIVAVWKLLAVIGVIVVAALAIYLTVAD